MKIRQFRQVIRVSNSRLADEEINVASKLGEDTAEAYEILISNDARKAAGKMSGLTFTITGMHQAGFPEVYRVTSSTHS